MPEPTPAAQGANNVGKLLKRVPTWAWLAGGGAVIGLGWAYMRDRNAPPVADLGVEAAPTDTTEFGYVPQAIGNVPPIVPVVPESETVGAIGQTAVQTIGDVFGETLAGVIAKLPSLEDYASLIESQAQIPGAAAAQPPPPATPAPPPPAVDAFRASAIANGWRWGQGVAGFMPPGAVASKPNQGSGTNRNGHYVTHAFLFGPNNVKRYNHYGRYRNTGKDKWVGPF